MATDVADHAVAHADDVAADRLTEDLAVERSHAFNVAGRDAQQFADGVNRAVRHPAAFLLNDLQGFDRRCARIFVVMHLVLDGRALGFAQGETVCLDKRAVHA